MIDRDKQTNDSGSLQAGRQDRRHDREEVKAGELLQTGTDGRYRWSVVTGR
jgi:hypothetical protein